MVVVVVVVMVMVVIVIATGATMVMLIDVEMIRIQFQPHILQYSLIIHTERVVEVVRTELIRQTTEYSSHSLWGVIGRLT